MSFGGRGRLKFLRRQARRVRNIANPARKVAAARRLRAQAASAFGERGAVPARARTDIAGHPRTASDRAFSIRDRIARRL